MKYVFTFYVVSFRYRRDLVCEQARDESARRCAVDRSLVVMHRSEQTHLERHATLQSMMQTSEVL